MLDYAAIASAYWDAGQLRTSFESRFADAEAATDELSVFIEDDFEPETFWDAVAANLKERRLRLVFVADRIPAELRSIVEFLNEQLRLTDVIAVEIKQYMEPDGQRVNIVPRVIGDTEWPAASSAQAAPVGRAEPRSSSTPTCARPTHQTSPSGCWRSTSTPRHTGPDRGSGAASPHRRRCGWASTRIPRPPNPLALTFWGGAGGLGVNMKYFRGRRTPEEMARLVGLLRRLPGTSEVLEEALAKDYRTFCTFRADRVLATDEDLEAFKHVLDEAAVRASAAA